MLKPYCEKKIIIKDRLMRYIFNSKRKISFANPPPPTTPQFHYKTTKQGSFKASLLNSIFFIFGFCFIYYF